MGHSSIAITFVLYGHLFEDREGDRDAMSKLEVAVVAAEYCIVATQTRHGTNFFNDIRYRWQPSKLEVAGSNPAGVASLPR